MAFHPFKHFRKYQKVYLVATTILTMIIFVASFGAGDLFSSLQRWLALSVPRGEKVLTLYGKSIRTDELDLLRFQRQLASEFLLYDVGGNIESPLQQSLSAFQKKFSPKKGTNDLPTPVETAFMEMSRAVNRASQAIARNAPAEERLQPLRSGMDVIQSQLAKVESASSGQYRALDAIATSLAIQAWLIDPQRRPNDSYFGGSLQPEELLDFLVWKHQADRLGIALTPADVCRLVNRAWGHGADRDYLPPDSKFESNEWVVAFFRYNTKIHKQRTPHDLLNALTDEFRVQMAKAALLGSASGVRGYRESVDDLHVSPSAATPDEFYKYFQEQRTTLSVSILPIPVDRFVSEVEKKAQPSETDLRNLFERYKNDEPSPERRQPGFKEPRRVKVEYFRFQLEGPFAQKLAARAVELLPVFRVGQPALAYAAGGGFAWAASLAVSADLDENLRSLYEKYREEAKQSGWIRELPNQQSVGLRASAATVGELLGSLGTGATSLSGPTCWMGTHALYVRNTATAYASTVLAAASSSPLPALTLPLSVYVPPTFEGAREQLVERFRNTLAKNLMEKNVLTFRKELEKVLAGHSQEKLSELLKKTVAEYGAEDIHVMKEAQTRQEISDRPDAALEDLRQAYEGSLENPFEPFAFLGQRESRPDFVSALFHPAELTDMERQWAARGLKIDRPVRSWQFHAPSGDGLWVFWRSEDKPAHVRRFDMVRDEVRKAWYQEQARKLAREKAQQINEKLKEQNLAPDVAVSFLTEQDLGTVFQLNKISHLEAPDFSLPGAKITAANYRVYQPPREFIPYPPADFVDQLLKLRKRGESLVMADKPVQHFYVAVLMEDPQPAERREFYGAYRQTSADSLGLLPSPEEPLWSQMMADRQRTYARKLMEQMRAEATKDLQDGDYVLPESVRNRSESSRDFGE